MVITAQPGQPRETTSSLRKHGRAAPAPGSYSAPAADNQRTLVFPANPKADAGRQAPERSPPPQPGVAKVSAGHAGSRKREVAASRVGCEPPGGAAVTGTRAARASPCHSPALPIWRPVMPLTAHRARRDEVTRGRPAVDEQLGLRPTVPSRRSLSLDRSEVDPQATSIDIITVSDGDDQGERSPTRLRSQGRRPTSGCHRTDPAVLSRR